MGVRNYLVEGVSGTGKTSVCEELERRGHRPVHGDRELAYQGDPVTGEATDTAVHQHHIWDVARVRALVEDDQAPFIDLFDEVFVLDVDLETLHRQLDQRPQGGWGSTLSERDLVVRLHRTREDIPETGTVIEATTRPRPRSRHLTSPTAPRCGPRPGRGGHGATLTTTAKVHG
ncbi:nucleoside kinase [Nocardioides psychrotolerans]|uniref:AAA domain-containing protein n=1 Tax=Nocardioides psychrotolerans TaxID=1005945 RepID=A0A1I3DS70_9ACTN|nr:nucleoside kinase [Nocardioides psychrotolerans]SFH89399.1 hypothetical protein SAMN05216561_10354 [Nocardioides psychrotolerans]